MKKVIIAVVIAGMLVGGFLWLRKQRLEIGVLDAKIETVRRGDLVIPIKASGKIQPRSRREIKSKASGEVISAPDTPGELAFDYGQMVRKGDVLVTLKRDDEQRNLDAAKAARDQAKVALDIAEISLRERIEAGVPAAEAARDRARAQRDYVKAQYDFKMEGVRKNPAAFSRDELALITAQYEEAEATLRSAEVDVTRAKIAIDLARKDVEKARSALETADTKLKDAEERYAETEVRSPMDGMILRVFVHVGEMIQSGTQSLTGGTVLMEVADVSEVYMIASVDEADIGKVREMAPVAARPGADPRAATRATTKQMVEQDVIKEETPVEITVEAFPGDQFYGVIERISPQSEVQAAVATFEVRIRVTSPNRDKIRNLVGMQAEAKFTSVPLTNALLVPYEAVQRGPTGDLGVYVPVKKPGASEETPEFRPCKFGQDNGVDVVVLEGVREGDRVYTKLPVRTRSEQKAEGEEPS